MEKRQRSKGREYTFYKIVKEFPHLKKGCVSEYKKHSEHEKDWIWEETPHGTYTSNSENLYRHFGI